MNKKINNKIMILLILTVLINIGFISAFITDQYVVSGSGSVSKAVREMIVEGSSSSPTPAPTPVPSSTSSSSSYSSSSSSSSSTSSFPPAISMFTNSFSLNMNFKYDSITGWNGTGKFSTYFTSWDKYSGSSMSKTKKNITCLLGTCIIDSYSILDYYPDEAGRYPIEESSSQTTTSPPEFSAPIGNYNCDKNDVNNFEYTSNCMGGNDHYKKEGHGSYNDEAGACSYSYNINHKKHFCTDSNGDGNQDSNDYTCDFNDEKYESGYCSTEWNNKVSFDCCVDEGCWLEKPEDAKNNRDVDVF